MQWAQFLAKLMPELLSLARELFTKHKGDAAAARRDIQSRKASITRDREKSDLEIARFKRFKATGTHGAPGCRACLADPGSVCDQHQAQGY